MRRITVYPTSTILGGYRRPSTLDVICTVNSLDIAARRAGYLFDGYEERRARSERRLEDSEAIEEQIYWLCDSADPASDPDERSKFAELAEYLLGLQKDIIAEERLDQPKVPLLPTVGQMLYVPVAYALSVLRNLVLLVLLWIALALAVIAILKAV
jgi:hypothetical protein